MLEEEEEEVEVDHVNNICCCCQLFIMILFFPPHNPPSDCLDWARNRCFPQHLNWGARKQLVNFTFPDQTIFNFLLNSLSVWFTSQLWGDIVWKIPFVLSIPELCHILLMIFFSRQFLVYFLIISLKVSVLKMSTYTDWRGYRSLKEKLNILYRQSLYLR